VRCHSHVRVLMTAQFATLVCDAVAKIVMNSFQHPNCEVLVGGFRKLSYTTKKQRNEGFQIFVIRDFRGPNKVICIGVAN
jgi:hypothetical protein